MLNVQLCMKKVQLGYLEHCDVYSTYGHENIPQGLFLLSGVGEDYLSVSLELYKITLTKNKEKRKRLDLFCCYS